jgi:hypothetical protein
MRLSQPTSAGDPMPDDRKYTLAEIKAAFWSTFHEAGEIWLPYGDDKAGNQQSTLGWWRDFAENLDPSLEVDISLDT